MFYSITLYISLGVLFLGLAYRIVSWYRYGTGVRAKGISRRESLFAAAKGIAGIFSSRRSGAALLGVFFWDILLLRKLLREDFLRWLAHILMAASVVLLILMHAMDGLVTRQLFPNSSPTVNPYLFLRNLFGFMVFTGIGLAIYRRVAFASPRFKGSRMDIYAIGILAVITISGVGLEGVKMSSHTLYRQMVSDWTDDLGEQESRDLEAFWVERFGTVSSVTEKPQEGNVLTRGEALHEMYCAECHSRNTFAFMGYAAAKLVAPVALILDEANVGTLLWHIHFLACFIGLAYLPFSKFFHIVATPVSLAANSLKAEDVSGGANISVRQIIELDACTHCGMCTDECSVGIAFEAIDNVNILPSEKLRSLKRLVSGREIGREEMRRTLQGCCLCTDCGRCSAVCPAGIHLGDLWADFREALLHRGEFEPLVLSPFSFPHGLRKSEKAGSDRVGPARSARARLPGEGEWSEETAYLSEAGLQFKEAVLLSHDARTFSSCFGCETCSAVCPVVANYDDPVEVLGLIPHQIMHCLALGLKDRVFASRMQWDCLTCYLCEEHCPQGVRVTDVLYRIKRLAVRQID